MHTAAKRYLVTSESAESVARIAQLACKQELANAGEQVGKEGFSMTFRNSMFETLERSVLDETTVLVMEQRIRK